MNIDAEGNILYCWIVVFDYGDNPFNRLGDRNIEIICGTSTGRITLHILKYRHNYGSEGGLTVSVDKVFEIVDPGELVTIMLSLTNEWPTIEW